MSKKIPIWVWIIGGFAVMSALASSNKKVRTAVVQKTTEATKKITAAASTAVAKVKAAINFMQWTQSQKIESLEPNFRAKVERILARLKAQGYSPKLDYGWRDLAYQQELVKKGASKTTFSWHNVTNAKGEPMALAADIVQTKPDWNTSNPFWKALGEAARAEGLVWGGDWKTLKDYPHVQMYPDAQLALYKASTLKALAVV